MHLLLLFALSDFSVSLTIVLLPDRVMVCKEYLLLFWIKNKIIQVIKIKIVDDGLVHVFHAFIHISQYQVTLTQRVYPA